MVLTTGFFICIIVLAVAVSFLVPRSFVVEGSLVQHCYCYCYCWDLLRGVGVELCNPAPTSIRLESQVPVGLEVPRGFRGVLQSHD